MLHRVCAGHGKSGKSWNYVISSSMPRKTWILIVGHGNSLKIMFMEKNHLVSILLGEKNQEDEQFQKNRKGTKRQIFTQ